MIYLYSLGFPDYGTIGIFEIFNSKCENVSLLVIKPLPCGVPDGW